MLQVIFSYLIIIGSLSPYAEEMVHSLVSYKEMEEAAMANELFRKVQVSGEGGSYVVIGEARSKVGEFYYVVEDGHNILVPEKRKKVTENEWSNFKIEIRIPKEDFPDNGTIILYLYNRNADGKMVNDLPIILEESQQADN